jgi:hypothetical protein
MPPPSDSRPRAVARRLRRRAHTLAQTHPAECHVCHSLPPFPRCRQMPAANALACLTNPAPPRDCSAVRSWRRRERQACVFCAVTVVVRRTATDMARNLGNYSHGWQPGQLQSRLATWTTIVTPGRRPTWTTITIVTPGRQLSGCTAPCCDASLTELRDVALSSPADAGRSMAPPSRTGMLRDFSSAGLPCPPAWARWTTSTAVSRAKRPGRAQGLPASAAAAAPRAGDSLSPGVWWA